MSRNIIFVFGYSKVCCDSVPYFMTICTIYHTSNRVAGHHQTRGLTRGNCVFILRYDANVLRGPDGCDPGRGRQGRSLVAARDRSCGGGTHRDADQAGVLCCGGAITPALWTNSAHRPNSVSALSPFHS
jgi:hypothetical protein